MKKVTPFLWFTDQAEPAAKLYVSLLPRSKITRVQRHQGAKKGPAFSVSFTLAGQDFIALNGGPHYSLTPAFSMYVDCADQKEVDRLWKKLLANGGKESRCGWLTDRFGLSWQIIPQALPKLLASKNPKKAAAVMQAMMGMVKLDVAGLQRAHDAA